LTKSHNPVVLFDTNRGVQAASSAGGVGGASGGFVSQGTIISSEALLGGIVQGMYGTIQQP